MCIIQVKCRQVNPKGFRLSPLVDYLERMRSEYHIDTIIIINIIIIIQYYIILFHKTFSAKTNSPCNHFLPNIMRQN